MYEHCSTRHDEQLFYKICTCSFWSRAMTPEFLRLLSVSSSMVQTSLSKILKFFLRTHKCLLLYVWMWNMYPLILLQNWIPQNVVILSTFSYISWNETMNSNWQAFDSWFSEHLLTTSLNIVLITRVNYMWEDNISRGNYFKHIHNDI